MAKRQLVSPSSNEDMNHGNEDFQVQADIDGIDIEKEYLTFSLIMNVNGQVEKMFEGF